MSTDEKKNGAEAKGEKSHLKVLGTIERELVCQLTQEEAKGDLAAKLHAEAAELRVKKKMVSDEFTQEIKGREAAVAKLLSQMKMKQETRLVEVEEIANFRDDVVIQKRTDTKKTIGTRPIRDNERQVTLAGIEGGKAEPKEKPKRGKKPKLAAVTEAASTA